MSPTSYRTAPPRVIQTSTALEIVGLGRVELPTSRLSGVRSNQLSYRPLPEPRKLAARQGGINSATQPIDPIHGVEQLRELHRQRLTARPRERPILRRHEPVVPPIGRFHQRRRVWTYADAHLEVVKVRHA